MIGRRMGIPILVALVLSLLSACAGSGPATTVRPSAVGGSGSLAPPATSTPSPAVSATPSADSSAGASAGCCRPPASTTPTASAQESAMPFSLTSSAFSNDGPIPRRYACDGADVSPALAWEGAPDGTVSLALLVDDPDARGFVHWVLFDLTGAASGGLPEGYASSPDAPPQGTNGFGRVGYGGPCPPSGTHRYVFALYALDRTLALTGAPKADAVRSAMEGHVLAETKLVGTYHR